MLYCLEVYISGGFIGYVAQGCGRFILCVTRVQKKVQWFTSVDECLNVIHDLPDLYSYKIRKYTEALRYVV